MSGDKRDVITDFYDVLEEMGEYCAFQIGRYQPDMAAPEWTRFRHQEYDGAKAFAAVIRQRTNIDVDIETSPNPPSLWTLIVAFVNLFIDGLRRGKPMRWRRANANWRPTPQTASPPKAVAWSLFTGEETQELGRIARSHRVSQQAWLLWALKEAVASELVPGSGTLAWYVPVSVHGAFAGAKGNSNFSLEVRFPPEATPADVYAAIRREQRLRRHWVIAKATYAFSWMVRRWMLRPLARLALRLPPWQGSFSTSGSMGQLHEGIDEWFIGLNPVVKTSPVGCSSVEWLGHLSLSIQIHPSISDDPQVARDWVDAWRRIALSTAAPSLPAPTAVENPPASPP